MDILAYLEFQPLELVGFFFENYSAHCRQPNQFRGHQATMPDQHLIWPSNVRPEDADRLNLTVCSYMLAQRLQFINLLTRPAAAGFCSCLEVTDGHDIAHLNRIELDFSDGQLDNSLAGLAGNLFDGAA
jgi:hypothetical protein